MVNECDQCEDGRAEAKLRIFPTISVGGAIDSVNKWTPPATYKQRVRDTCRHKTGRCLSNVCNGREADHLVDSFNEARRDCGG